MKNKYFNKLTMSLFVLGVILIILALSPIGSLSENIVDFVNNLLASFGVSFIMLAITISFIQYYLDQQQLTTVEKYEKEKEKKYILGHHNILSVLISRYQIVFSNLIKDNSDFDFYREFDFKDLSELYEINGFVITDIFSTKIEVFYKGEEVLIKHILRMLEGTEFKYNKNLSFILSELLKISLEHDMVKEGILSNPELRKIVKNMFDNKEDYVKKYLNNELKSHVAIPYILLYFFLKNQRKLIVKYLEEIRKIQQEE